MTLHGWTAWINVAQLMIAGLTAMLGIQQLAVWRWEGRQSSARHVALSAACAVAVLVSNTALLASLHSSTAPVLVLVRGAALAALTLSMLPLADALADNHPPRTLRLAIIGLVGVRLTASFTTDLLYRHRFVNDLPVYGPLSSPSGLALIVLLFAYLLIVAAHGRTDRERTVLALGILGSLVVAGASFLATPPVDELLTGYLTLPALAGITGLIWVRQSHAQRVVGQFGQRQQALANLSRMALTEPLGDLLLAARVTFITHLPDDVVARVLPAMTPSGGLEHAGTHACRDAHDKEFVRAVSNIIAAATDRARTSEEMERRATHDDLTGLPNRRLIRVLIDEALAGVHGNASVAVAFCNLDRFKTVNDAYGHPSGDQILRLVADRLSAVARPCDRVGRFGSDEFAIICADPDGLDTVEALSDRIHSVFQHSIQTESIEAQVTASVGVVLAKAGDAQVDADTLLRDAVTAMHDAKARGASTGRFHHDLRTAVIYRADIERRLIGAVNRGEIVVHYQPIVDMSTSAIVGFEALARWQQGNRLVPPAEWIPVAETTELIHEIGEHVLLTAARQAAEWRDVGSRVSVSVNVSARQLAAVRLERAVLAALTHVPADALVIEVTESMAVDEVAQRSLRKLRERGIRTALDDFGTGYSALASVARLPIDIIKIDQSITRRVNHPDGKALVSATVAIAQALGMSVVAEGVETIAQHRDVSDLGCHLAQGNLYSQPLDAAAATLLLADDRVRDVIRHGLRSAPEPMGA